MPHMENARTGAGAVTAGGPDAHHTPRSFNLQGTLDRALGHEFPAEALGALLALRLDRPRRFLLAIGALMALDPEDREALAEAALGDSRAGPPLPPFADLRAEAADWAAWASPGERRAYLAATWNALPNHDRRAFTSRVMA